MCENMTARNKTQYTYKLICFESIFNLSGQNLNFNKFVSIKQKLKKNVTKQILITALFYFIWIKFLNICCKSFLNHLLYWVLKEEFHDYYIYLFYKRNYIIFKSINIQSEMYKTICQLTLIKHLLIARKKIKLIDCFIVHN